VSRFWTQRSCHVGAAESREMQLPEVVAVGRTVKFSNYNYLIPFVQIVLVALLEHFPTAGNSCSELTTLTVGGNASHRPLSRKVAATTIFILFFVTKPAY